MSLSPSPEPSATPVPTRPEERGDDATTAVPTEAAAETLEAMRGARDVLAAAAADLAQRLGASEEDIRVRSIAAVLWPDTSLGCPEPDMVYAQVETPGYIILLELEGESYRYHTDRSDRVVLCPDGVSGELPLIPLEPGQIDDGIPWMPVD